MANTNYTGGIGLGGGLFLLFLGLRLTDNIDWAWYWIAAPLWIPLGLALLIFLSAVGYYLVKGDD